jgi:hypothetical protein
MLGMTDTITATPTEITDVGAKIAAAESRKKMHD